AAAIAVRAKGGGEHARAVPAGSLDLGYLQSRHDASEVRAAVERVTRAANDGDVGAQLVLGKTYLQGLPAIPKDAARAHDWFLRAAAAGNASAAYYLGVMSQGGEGTKMDPVEAGRWFEKAASAGSPHAMFLLANAYRAGAGVAKDPAKALELYRRASELEHPAALQTLAMAYLHGELGLEPDESEYRRYEMEAEHALQHPPALP
ncbi:MAG TPA: tetratricopeptide repeat protein, partial [Polyangiaceae bacterium]|nr:tetratricopeptide repeat protein [Polyangiaceae bacterium]